MQVLFLKSSLVTPLSYFTALECKITCPHSHIRWESTEYFQNIVFIYNKQQALSTIQKQSTIKKIFNKIQIIIEEKVKDSVSLRITCLLSSSKLSVSLKTSDREENIFMIIFFLMTPFNKHMSFK